MKITLYGYLNICLFSFKKHILNNHPKEVLSLDEFIKLRTEVVNEAGAAVVGDDAPPGDEAPPGVEDGTKVDYSCVKCLWILLSKDR